MFMFLLFGVSELLKSVTWIRSDLVKILGVVLLCHSVILSLNLLTMFCTFLTLYFFCILCASVYIFFRPVFEIANLRPVEFGLLLFI